MGNMGMAADWRAKAVTAIALGQSESTFAGNATQGTLRKAVTAYRLVMAEQPPPCVHCSPEVAAAFGLDKLAAVAPHLVVIDVDPASYDNAPPFREDDGTSGQDRKHYTDTQDRKNYTQRHD